MSREGNMLMCTCLSRGTVTMVRIQQISAGLTVGATRETKEVVVPTKTSEFYAGNVILANARFVK
jgi:hypothetical protein